MHPFVDSCKKVVKMSKSPKPFSLDLVRRSHTRNLLFAPFFILLFRILICRNGVVPVRRYSAKVMIQVKLMKTTPSSKMTKSSTEPSFCLRQRQPLRNQGIKGMDMHLMKSLEILQNPSHCSKQCKC